MSEDRKRGGEKKRERLNALLYLAEQDMEAAKLLAAHDNHYAAYHCQQAAEKYLKAVLQEHQIVFPRTH